MTVTISEIEAAIFSRSAALPAALLGDLQMPSLPTPYIAPTFTLAGATPPAQADVLIIKAQAAAGKSVTAQYLSASRNAPLLDLAAIPVASGSLAGLVPEGYLDEFHAGQFPIILDALDEGRLCSGDASFDAFLESTRTLLGRGRRDTQHARLVCLGRSETAEWSSLVIEDAADIIVCVVELDFFTEDTSKELIALYSQKEIDRLFTTGRYTATKKSTQLKWMRSEPRRRLLDAYLAALERALDIPEGQLWKDPRGVSFAGYAPVLASIGELLAGETNSQEMMASLKGGGVNRAWDVLDKVISAILDREQGKFAASMPSNRGAVPEAMYSASEQLVYLIQLVESGGSIERISLTDTCKFDDNAVRIAYLDGIRQYLPEHPFIRDSEVANRVLGAVILAHVTTSGGRLGANGLHLLQALCRQPFLWRFAEKNLRELDGLYLGCIVRSYLSDPAAGNRSLTIAARDDGGANISVGGRAHFIAYPPVTLYGEVVDCDVFGDVDLCLEGDSRNSKNRKFVFRGKNSIQPHVLKLECDVIGIGADGETGLNPRDVEVPTGGVTLDRAILSNGAKYFWGEVLGQRTPWSQYPSTLSDPNRDPLVRILIDELERINDSIVLLANYRAPQDNRVDPTPVDVLERRRGDIVGRFIKALVESHLATRHVIDARRNRQKYRISGVDWTTLRESCLSGSDGGDPKMGRFLEWAKTIEDLEVK